MSALLFLIVGATLLMQPLSSMTIITLVVGVALLVAGVLRLSTAIALRQAPGSAWRFFNAVISIVLGGMVVWSWPGSSLWFIGTIIAVEMIFSGWALLFMALTPRSREA